MYAGYWNSIGKPQMHHRKYEPCYVLSGGRGACHFLKGHHRKYEPYCQVGRVHVTSWKDMPHTNAIYETAVCAEVINSTWVQSILLKGGSILWPYHFHLQISDSYTHIHTPITYTHTTHNIQDLQNTYMVTSFHCNVTITIGTPDKADLSWYVSLAAAD